MRAPARAWTSAAIAVVVACALAFAPSGAASAHDYLVGTDPASGSTLSTAPTSVTLTFNDVVLDLGGAGTGATIVVTGADGAHAETGCARVDGVRVSVPVHTTAAGTYTVQWRVVSADGHPVEGSFAFSTSAAQDASASPAPTCGAGSTATTTPDPAPPSPPLPLMLVIAALVLVIGLLVGLYVWYSRGRAT